MGTYIIATIFYSRHRHASMSVTIDNRDVILLDQQMYIISQVWAEGYEAVNLPRPEFSSVTSVLIFLCTRLGVSGHLIMEIAGIIRIGFTPIKKPFFLIEITVNCTCFWTSQASKLLKPLGLHSTNTLTQTPFWEDLLHASQKPRKQKRKNSSFKQKTKKTEMQEFLLQSFH